MAIHLVSYLIFMEGKLDLELREDIDTVLAGEYGYFNGTDDHDT